MNVDTILEAKVSFAHPTDSTCMVCGSDEHGEINIETRYWEGFPEPTVQDVVACPLCLKYAIKELAEQIENEIDARRDERNADRKASR